MANKTIQQVLDDAQEQIDTLKGSLRSLKSIDRAEYPEAAYELAREAAKHAERLRRIMSGLAGTYSGQSLRRSRRINSRLEVA